MALENLSSLSQDEQFEEAAKFAGVPASVLRSMWRVESGEGKNMLSPAGAEGHFQIMPETRKTWEGRVGKTLDPYNFSEGLELAALTMKENMQLAKGDLPNALRWYNAGAPARWDNEETRAYVGKVLGEDFAAAPAAAPVGDVMDASASNVLGRAPLDMSFAMNHSAYDLQQEQRKLESGTATQAYLTSLQKGLVKKAGVDSAVAALLAGADPAAAALQARAVAAYAPEEFRAAWDSQMDAPAIVGDARPAIAIAVKEEAEAARREAERTQWTWMDRLGAGIDSNAVTAGFSRYMDRETETNDPSFNYMAHLEELEKFRSSEEITELRGSRSLQEANRIRARQDQERLNMQVMSSQSDWGALGWSLAGGIADPAGWAAGFGTYKLAHLAGIGARTAFIAGNTGRGLLYAGVEGAVGNVALTGALHGMGEYQSTNDYAMAAGFGLVMGGTFGAFEIRGAKVQAAEIYLRELGEKISKEAARREASLNERVLAEVGEGASPEQFNAAKLKLQQEDTMRTLEYATGLVEEENKLIPTPDEEATPTPRTDDTPTPRTDRDEMDEVVGLDDDFAPRDPMDGSDQPLPAAQNPGYYSPEPEHRVVLGRRVYDRRVVNAWRDSVNKKSLAPLMRQIADLPNLRPDFRLLAAKLARVVDTNGLTPASVGTRKKYTRKDGKQTAGTYFPDEHEVHLTSYDPDIALHEVLHAFTFREMRDGGPLVKRMDDLLAHIRYQVAMNRPKGLSASAEFRLLDDKASFPLMNKDELLAYGFTDAGTQELLRSIPAPEGTGGVFENAWQWFLDAVDSVLGKSSPESRTALDELMDIGTRMLDENTRELDPSGVNVRPRITPSNTVVPSEGPAAAVAPPETFTPDKVFATQAVYDAAVARYGLDKTVADDAERKLIAAMYVRAEGILSRVDIDKDRLKPLLSAVGWEANSTRMLLSESPILRAFAVIALENPEGAAGRTATAAITKQMLYQAYRGDTDVQFRGVYEAWRNKNGGSAARDFIDESNWHKFNKEVYAFRDARWNGKASAAPSEEVQFAADILDKAYARMGADQVTMKTLGHARIDPNRLGYQSRMMSPGMAANMSDAQRNAYLEALSGEFQATAGMDKTFADKFAVEYLARARSEGKGMYEVPANLHDPHGAAVLRDALVGMGMTPQQVKQNLEKFSRGGASHTKARIEADLTQPYGASGVKLMDLMITDNLYLLNKYAHRVSGEVALAKFGIYGDVGLKTVRRAAEVGGDGNKATVAELEAFDQTAAEFLGRPFGTALGKWAANALAATSSLRLGGMGFNQLGEYANGVGALGIGRVLSTIGSFPRLLGEVRKAAKGEKVDNPILGSLETYGGAFGVGDYQMKGMFDVNENYEVAGQEALNVFDKVVRAGSFGNRVASGHRAITAVQTRGMAEQIVLKALRMIREGRDDAAMKDMGFSPDVQAAIRTDINAAATWSPNGEPMSFDITKITDVNAANAFMQSVHRGANQIIQGTFIGERGKWANDGWLRLLTQFRTYGLTATQKQWRRQKFAYGTARATMLLIGAMSVAVPIHLARVALRAVGRDDQEEFIERETHPLRLARATMNYVAAAGLLPDLFDTAGTLVGSEATGARAGNQTPFVGGQIVPAVGVINDAWRVAVSRDPHRAAKLIPGSNLPYLQGAINALDE